MSSVDERVVKMEFDNARFENGVKDSMNTIKNLEVSLRNLDDTEVSFDQIQRAADGMKLDAIVDRVDKINSRFSMMGIVGGTAIAKITNSAMNILGGGLQKLTSGIEQAWNTITTGGMQRAQNIEQAKFQIEGLGRTWEEVSGSIDEAVNDTAYGLDEAALAASQFLATGIETGDQMTTALRSISGVAAMTNSGYSEIANIMTTIAGNGRVMTMQLNQLGAKGINAAATIRDYFNSSEENLAKFTKLYNETKKKNQASLAPGTKATEQNVRDMVTNSAIDFETFTAAMDQAYGEHAKDAQRTFTGASSNVQAALKRLGADFKAVTISSEDYDKTLDSKKKADFTKTTFNQINVLNELRNVIKGLQSDVKSAGLVELFTEIYQSVSRGMSYVLNSMYVTGDNGTTLIPQLSESIANLKAVLENLVGFVLGIGSSIDTAWKSIFPQSLPDTILTVTTKLRELSDMLPRVGSLSETISDIFGVEAKVADDTVESVDSLQESHEELTQSLRDLVKQTINGDFGNHKERMDKLGESYQQVQDAVNLLYDDQGRLHMDWISKIDETVRVGSKMVEITDETVEGQKNAADAANSANDAYEDIQETIEESAPSIREYGNSFDGLREILKGLFSLVKAAKKIIVGIADIIGMFVMPVVSRIAEVLVEIVATIASFVTALTGAIPPTEDFHGMLVSIADVLKPLWDAFYFVTQGIIDFMRAIRPDSDPFGRMKEYVGGFVEDIQGSDDKIGTLLGHMPSFIQDFVDRISSITLPNGVQLGTAVMSTFGPIINIIAGLLSAIIGGLSSLVSKIAETIRNTPDLMASIKEKFQPLLGFLGDFAKNVMNVMGEIFPAFGEYTQKISDSMDFTENPFEKFANMIHTFVDDMIEALRNLTANDIVQGIVGFIKGAISAVGTAAKTLVDVIFSVATQILTAGPALINSIMGILSVIAWGILLPRALTKFFNALSGSIEGLKGILESIAGAIDKLSDSVSFKMVSEGIKNIAISLAIFTGSIMVLGVTDWSTIEQGIFAMFLVLLTLVGITKFISNLEGFDDAAGSFLKMAGGYLAFAIALTIGMKMISSSLHTFKSMVDDAVSGDSVDSLVAAILMLVTLATVLVSLQRSLSKVEPVALRSSLSFIALGAGLIFIAKALATLSDIEFGSLLGSFLSLVGMLAVLSFMGKAMSKFNFNLSGIGPSLIAIGLGMILLGNALKLVSGIGDGIYVALGAVAMLTLYIGLLAKACSGTGGKLAAAGFGLLLISAALSMLVTAVFAMQNALNTSNFSEAVGMVLLLTAMLAGLATRCSESSGSMLVGAAAMLVISGALSMLVGTVFLMQSAMNAGNFSESVGMILVLVSALAILSKVCSNSSATMLVGAASLILMAGALSILVGTVFLMQNAMGDGNLMNTVVVIGVLTAALALLSSVCMKARANMLVGAAGMVLIAGALTILAVACSIMSKVASGPDMLAGVAAIAILLVGLVAMGAIAKFVAPGLAILSGALLSIVAVVLVVTVAIVAGAVAFSIMLDAIAEFSTMNVDLLGIAGGLAVLGASLIPLAIGAALLGAAMIVLGGGSIIGAVGLGALAIALMMIVGVISVAIGLFQMAGDAIMNGLLGGIINGIGSVISGIGGVAQGIIGTFCSILGIASPSKVFQQFGGFITQGVAQGISGDNSAENAMGQLGSDLMSKFQSSTSGFGDAGSLLGSSAGEGVTSGFESSMANFDIESIMGGSFDMSSMGDLFGSTGGDWSSMLGSGMSESTEPVEAAEEKVQESADKAKEKAEVFKEVGTKAMEQFALGMQQFDSSAFFNGLQGDEMDGMAKLVSDQIAQIEFDSQAFENAGKTCMNSFADGVSYATEGIKTQITTMVEGAAANVKLPKLEDPGTKMGADFVKGLNSNLEAARTAGHDLAQGAHDAASGVDMWWTGYWMGNGFVRGIKTNLEAAYWAGHEIGSQAKKGAEDAGQVKSPSKVMRRVGGYFGEGFTLGMLDEVNNASGAGSTMANAALDSVSGIISSILSYFDGNADLTPTIRPVLDMTDVNAGLMAMSSNPMFGMAPNVGAIAANANASAPYAGGNVTYMIDMDLHYQAGTDAGQMAEDLVEEFTARIRMEG